MLRNFRLATGSSPESRTHSIRRRLGLDHTSSRALSEIPRIASPGRDHALAKNIRTANGGGRFSRVNSLYVRRRRRALVKPVHGQSLGRLRPIPEEGWCYDSRSAARDWAPGELPAWRNSLSWS